MYEKKSGELLADRVREAVLVLEAALVGDMDCDRVDLWELLSSIVQRRSILLPKDSIGLSKSFLEVRLSSELQNPDRTSTSGGDGSVSIDQDR